MATKVEERRAAVERFSACLREAARRVQGLCDDPDLADEAYDLAQWAAEVRPIVEDLAADADDLVTWQRPAGSIPLADLRAIQGRVRSHRIGG